MAAEDRPTHDGQELISRRTLVKGGLSVAAVAFATAITARDGGAAVTSMDRAPVFAPLATDDTPKPGAKPTR